MLNLKQRRRTSVGSLLPLLRHGRRWHIARSSGKRHDDTATPLRLHNKVDRYAIGWPVDPEIGMEVSVSSLQPYYPCALGQGFDNGRHRLLGDGPASA